MNEQREIDQYFLEAVNSGDHDAAKKFLLQGAEIKAVNPHGNSAMHLAASNGDAGMVKLLAENGADIRQTDEKGNTALHIAIEKGHNRAVRMLLEYGYDTNAQNDAGATPLHTAVTCARTEIASDILDVKATDTTLTDRAGRTARDIAESVENTTIMSVIDKRTQAKAQGELRAQYAGRPKMES